MRTVVHLSDLHFGRHDRSVVTGLAAVIETARPDLIAISGDLTQRARTHEFEMAREFLRTVVPPIIVVPGNHDVPLYNLASRWLRPLDRYRRFISNDLQPSFLDNEIAVVGINTARSWTIKNGRINARQVRRACECLKAAADTAVRIVVTHHPFDLPAPGSSHAVVGRADMALRGLSGCDVDLILSGHHHRTHAASSAERYDIEGDPVLLVQAGTTTSTRRRGQVNACNVIRVEQSRIVIEWLTWNPDGLTFGPEAVDCFVKGDTGWAKGSPVPR
jgi:3',5'-cyclic AMP phosphodiesterase CpdA